jgi:galactose mutarotase-like enzyme
MSETVTIRSEALTARIALTGAELVSLHDASGAEWMTDGDPAVWAGHAPILFPIVGELAGGTYRLDGSEYALPRHGFARRREFELVEHTGNSAVLRLGDDAGTRAVWPFSFVLDLRYVLQGDALTMTAIVTNRGQDAMPFSIGFHPGFAWPLPNGGDKAKHRIIFSDFEEGPIRRLDEDGLLRAFEDTPVKNRVLRPYPGLFHADALIWDRLSSRSLRFEGETVQPEAGSDKKEAAAPAALQIAFPDCPMLGIWQKPDADFLCLEPWAGIADPEGFDGNLREKPGMMELAAGDSRRFDVTITIFPAEAGE